MTTTLTQTGAEVQADLDAVEAGNIGLTSITDLSDTTAAAAKKSGYHSLQASSANAPSTDRSVIVSAVRNTAASGELRYGQVLLTESNGLHWNTDDGGVLGTWQEGVSTAGTQTLTNKTISGGTLDNAIIGGSTPAAASVTTLSASGAITGNVTGNVTGTAATVTTAAQPAITSVGTLTGLTVSSTIAGSVNGNAATATKLASARTIDITGDITATAVAFDGTANIAISAAVDNDSHSHTGSTISALDGGDITTGTISDARLPATISSNITGSSASCTGNSATATSATTAGTVTTAAQAAITSVGTLTSLAVSGTLTSGAFTAGGIIKSGSNDIRAGTYNSSGSTAGCTLNASGLIEQSNTSTSLHEKQRFNNPNGQVGEITTSGSATAYNTSSDPRLKSAFTPITGALDMIVEARDQSMIGEFAFLTDPAYKVWGYNAHKLIDAQEGFGGTEGQGSRDAPLGGDVRPAGVDQSKRVPILEAAIGELLDRIKVLENEAP